MSKKQIEEIAKDYEYTNGVYGFKEGVKLQKKQQDEFAIGFAEWILRNWNNYGPNDERELLEIYKKEKGL